VPGSVEFKQVLLKRCFFKMVMGAVALSPIIVTLLQHKWGQPGTGLLVWLFLPIGAVLFVLTCVDYAKSKGLHPAMGLLGLGLIFGLMVLSLWPDRYKYDKEAKRELRKGKS
jgi:hypothetical protein